MSLKEQLKKETKSELGKLKKMSGKDKVWYIWEYYKLHMLALALIIFVFYIIGTIFYQRSFTTRLYTIIVNNTNAAGATTTQLDEDFKAYMGYGEKDRIETDPTLYIDTDNMGSEFSYASLAKVSALVGSKGLDVMVSDSATVDHYAGLNGMADLSQVLPEELYSRVEDNIYYSVNENGEEIPCAVSLEDTRYSELTGVEIDTIYFSIFSNSMRTETAAAYLEYILNQ